MTSSEPREQPVRGRDLQAVIWAMGPWSFVLAAFAYLLVEYLVAGRFGPAQDDGWIYLAFARSIAVGEGMTYPGYDGPVASVTGPIWCLLLGVGIKLFGHAVAVSKGLGLITGLLAVLAMRRLGRAATGDAMVGGLAAILLALSPRFLWGCASGMEVPFFVAAVCYGLALHIERRDQSWSRWLPALLWLWLAGWARPECFVFPVVAVLHRRRLDGVLTLLPLLLAYPAYHLWIWGHPLPTTFYAKAAGGSPLSILRHQGFGAALASLLESTSRQLGAFATYFLGWLPLLLLGLWPGLRRALRERSGVLVVAASLLLFMLARGALGYQSPGFQHGRYFTHLWPLLLVLCLPGFDQRRVASWPALLLYAALGLVFWLEPLIAAMSWFDWIDLAVFEQLGGVRGDVFFWQMLAALLLAVAIGAVTSRGGGLVARPPVWAILLWWFPAFVLGVQSSAYGVRDTYALNVVMAEQAREIVPEGETIACHDIGALGYFTERPLLDLAGLGSPEVAERMAAGAWDLAAMLEERRPGYVCLTTPMFEHLWDGRRPDGLQGIEVVAEVISVENVTVYGGDYRLFKLSWAQ